MANVHWSEATRPVGCHWTEATSLMNLKTCYCGERYRVGSCRHSELHGVSAPVGRRLPAWQITDLRQPGHVKTMRRNGRSSQRSFFLKAMEIDLQSAACDGDQPKVMKFLAAGANKDAADDDGATPMFMTAENGHAQVLKMLLAAGANKDASNNEGATPMTVAAQNGDAKGPEDAPCRRS